MGSVLLLVHSSFILDPDLMSRSLPAADLTVVVAPPPELLCSPGLGKFCKCSKVLAFEPSPAKPVEGLDSSLFLLSFDNEI
jgi:hypothetical protein